MEYPVCLTTEDVPSQTQRCPSQEVQLIRHVQLVVLEYLSSELGCLVRVLKRRLKKHEG